jgi:hypothetical protein
MYMVYNEYIGDNKQMEKISDLILKHRQAIHAVYQAWKAYDLAVDAHYDGFGTREAIDAALAAARKAENDKDIAYAAVETAKAEWLALQNQECTCRPNSTELCPVCQASQAQNEVPF